MREPAGETGPSSRPSRAPPPPAPRHPAGPVSKGKTAGRALAPPWLRLRTSCIAALGGVWLSACLAPDREDAAEGIVGGEACRADVSASVVMVGGHGGTNEVWGSAVLVAPDVLVTARHVVTRATPPRRQQCARDGTALPDAVPWELRPATGSEPCSVLLRSASRTDVMLGIAGSAAPARGCQLSIAAPES